MSAARPTCQPCRLLARELAFSSASPPPQNYVCYKWDHRHLINRAAVGFMGPTSAPHDPTYRAVCSGKTGHVEVLDVEFEAAGAARAEVYEALLRFFFMFHDPTTTNKQGNDVGTQYGSVIFVHDSEQRRIAEKVKRELQGLLNGRELRCYSRRTVTTAIAGATRFYPAVASHQGYLQRNPGGYCNHRMRFSAWPAQS